MANINSPDGGTPLRYRDGRKYDGQANAYIVPSSDGTVVGIGSFVKLTGAVSSATVNGQIKVLPEVIEATATATHRLLGCVVGVEPDFNDLSLLYRKASTARVVYVADSRDLIYSVQEASSTDAGAIQWSEAGMTTAIDVSTAALSTVTGRSGHMINSSPAADANGQFRVLKPLPAPNNETASTGKAYCRWEVAIALHQLDSYDTGI